VEVRSEGVVGGVVELHTCTPPAEGFPGVCQDYLAYSCRWGTKGLACPRQHRSIEQFALEWRPSTEVWEEEVLRHCSSLGRVVRTPWQPQCENMVTVTMEISGQVKEVLRQGLEVAGCRVRVEHRYREEAVRRREFRRTMGVANPRCLAITGVPSHVTEEEVEAASADIRAASLGAGDTGLVLMVSRRALARWRGRQVVVRGVAMALEEVAEEEPCYEEQREAGDWYLAMADRRRGRFVARGEGRARGKARDVSREKSRDKPKEKAENRKRSLKSKARSPKRKERSTQMTSGSTKAKSRDKSSTTRMGNRDVKVEKKQNKSVKVEKSD